MHWGKRDPGCSFSAGQPRQAAPRNYLCIFWRLIARRSANWPRAIGSASGSKALEDRGAANCFACWLRRPTPNSQRSQLSEFCRTAAFGWSLLPLCANQPGTTLWRARPFTMRHRSPLFESWIAWPKKDARHWRRGYEKAPLPFCSSATLRSPIPPGGSAFARGVCRTPTNCGGSAGNPPPSRYSGRHSARRRGDRGEGEKRGGQVSGHPSGNARFLRLNESYVLRYRPFPGREFERGRHLGGAGDRGTESEHGTRGGFRVRYRSWRNLRG